MCDSPEIVALKETSTRTGNRKDLLKRISRLLGMISRPMHGLCSLRRNEKNQRTCDCRIDVLQQIYF